MKRCNRIIIELPVTGTPVMKFYEEDNGVPVDELIVIDGDPNIDYMLMDNNAEPLGVRFSPNDMVTMFMSLYLTMCKARVSMEEFEQFLATNEIITAYPSMEQL